jgi:NADH-quinone oxidoreductase subunit G
LDKLFGPATGKTFNGDPLATGHNITDVKVGVGPNEEGTDSTNPDTH